MKNQYWKDLENLEDMAFNRWLHLGGKGRFVNYEKYLVGEEKKKYLHLKKLEEIFASEGWNGNASSKEK